MGSCVLANDMAVERWQLLSSPDHSNILDVSKPQTNIESVCVRVKCSLTLSTCLSNELALQQNVRQDRKFQQSEKFLDLGTVTRPPSSIYARVNCFVIRDLCTRVQGHPRNLFRRPWNFGLSSQKHHTWPYHASVLWYTEANFSFQMQQRNFPRPYLRNDTMDFLF